MMENLRPWKLFLFFCSTFFKVFVIINEEGDEIWILKRY